MLECSSYNNILKSANKMCVSVTCIACKLKSDEAGVVPNSDPCQIITHLVLVGLGLGVGEGLGLGVWLGLGNQVAILTRGVIIWQGVENGHNTGHLCLSLCRLLSPSK